MAAAALGNTISDVAGIGSAWYVHDTYVPFAYNEFARTKRSWTLLYFRVIAYLYT